MGTTTLGIPYPESTDLVKDGATDMQALAEAANDLYGLIHLNTTSYSAVSSVTLDPNIFSSNYEHYRLMINSKVTTGNQNLNARLVSGGTPNSSNNYAFNLIYMGPSSATVNGGNNTGSNLIPLTNMTTDDCMAASLDLYSPFNSARNTGYAALTARGDKGLLTIAGAMTVTTSYDSIQFFPDSSTMTGKIVVYGYKE